MKKMITFLAASLLLTASVSPSIANQEKNCVNPKEAYQEIKKSTVLIVSLDEDDNPAIGTGLVVDKKGTIITSTHVLQSKENIAVLDSDGNDFQYKSKQFGSSDSVSAIIPVDKYPKNHVLLKRNSVEHGETLYSVGHPLGTLFAFSVGFVASKVDDAIVASMVSGPGASGSAVFDCELKVVGFIYGLHREQRSFLFLNPVGDAIIEADKK